MGRFLAQQTQHQGHRVLFRRLRPGKHNKSRIYLMLLSLVARQTQIDAQQTQKMKNIFWVSFVAPQTKTQERTLLFGCFSCPTKTKHQDYHLLVCRLWLGKHNKSRTHVTFLSLWARQTQINREQHLRFLLSLAKQTQKIKNMLLFVLDVLGPTSKNART